MIIVLLFCSVCYIAGQLVNALNKEGGWFTTTEEICVKIAALCHDIGG